MAGSGLENNPFHSTPIQSRQIRGRDHFLHWKLYHARRADAVPERDRGDIGAGIVKMKRRIQMRSRVDAHRNRRDVARGPCAELRGPVVSKFLVPGPDRDPFPNRLRNIEDLHSHLRSIARKARARRSMTNEKWQMVNDK